MTTRPALAPFVAAYRIAASPMDRVTRVPDGCVSLIFRQHDASRADLHVLGPLTKVRYKAASSYLSFAKLAFRPGGALPFFGVALSDLTDKIVALESLWGEGAHALCDAVLRTADVDQRMVILEDALLARRAEGREMPAAMADAAAALAGGGIAVRDLAGKLGLAERTFRRHFTASVGLSPKRYARISRFRRALRHAAAGGGWAAIAVASGYYDQAHLLSEFQDLAGVSPERFMSDYAPLASRAPVAERPRSPPTANADR